MGDRRRPRRRACHSLERERNIARRLEALGRRLLETMSNVSVQSGNKAAKYVLQLLRIATENRTDRIGCRRTGEGANAAQHLIQRRTEVEDVTAMIDG